MPSSTGYTRAYRERRRAAGLPTNSPRQQEQINRWHRETYTHARADLLAILGDRCAGCGHADVRVLEFDHRHDDGAADRRRFKGARSMLTHYLARPDEAKARLQLLCRNCNWLKRKGCELPLKATAPQRPVHAVSPSNGRDPL